MTESLHMQKDLTDYSLIADLDMQKMSSLEYEEKIQVQHFFITTDINCHKEEEFCLSMHTLIVKQHVSLLWFILYS